jgi:choline dehydrogenase-like flavoprotein
VRAYYAHPNAWSDVGFGGPASPRGTNHLNGTARMGDDPRTSVVNPDGRTWDHSNLRACDGSVFPISGSVNPSLTIQAMALRTADRIEFLARRGEL